MADDDIWGGNTLGTGGTASPGPSGDPAYATAADANIMGSSGDPFAGNTMDSSGSNIGANATAIAKALNQLSSGLKQAGGGDSSGAGSARAAPVGQAASGTGQGSASGMNALVQMLMQNQNKYFPGGPNTQPVAQGRQAGLLGF